MPIFAATPPLSLYVHIPWCVQKCPYCDFNSHEAKGSLPEDHYVSAVIQELDSHLARVQNRPLVSIFFGGGTPSLFSAKAIERIIDGAAKRLTFNPTIEITLEANPGTIDQVRFRDFHQAGINRLSLGIQSLQNDKLKALGRIHDNETALRAVEIAKQAGFNNFNLDLMFGLPQQTLDDALHDLHLALACEPTHFSWYQLTIEPNTVFYKKPPTLPADETIWEMQQAGITLLKQQGLQQYEVSAYARPNKQCVHNLNYWQFGDYLGLGAGAHSKITHSDSGTITRFAQTRLPRDYLIAEKRVLKNITILKPDDLIFEFMLNALRLTQGVPATLFSERTGLSLDDIKKPLADLRTRGLLIADESRLAPSELGKRFLNDVLAKFLA